MSFAKWKYEIQTAKSLGWIDKDNIDNVSCVRFGQNCVAFGSQQFNSITFSPLDNPAPQHFVFKFDPADNIAHLAFSKIDPKLLLVVFEKHLVIMNTKTNEIHKEFDASDANYIPFISAEWLNTNNIISLTKLGIIVFNDNLEMIGTNNMTDKPVSIAVDDNTYYIGANREVAAYSFGEDGSINKKLSFIAHPRDINQIQICDDKIVTVSDGGAIIWEKSGIPMFKVKTKTPYLIVDPKCELGLHWSLPTAPLIYKIENGKKKEISEVLPLKSNWKKDISVSCDWMIEESGAKILLLGLTNGDECNFTYIIRFTLAE